MLDTQPITAAVLLLLRLSLPGDPLLHAQDGDVHTRGLELICNTARQPPLGASARHTQALHLRRSVAAFGS